jgi:hypothetical protein
MEKDQFITLNGVNKKWVKGKDGDWIESKKKWWKFWK